jgi:hypothetical protein
MPFTLSQVRVPDHPPRGEPPATPGHCGSVRAGRYSPLGGIAAVRAYGVVVDSVNVSVLAYVPVRRASVAPMCWLNAIGTTSLETGPA